MSVRKNFEPRFDSLHIKYPVKKRDTESEWWYFDAALDNGDHFVVMYSVNDTRLYPRQPSVRTNLYEADGTDYWLIRKFSERETAFSREKCDVRMGEQWCMDCGGYYEVYTNIDGYGAHLKFTPLVPSWQAGKDGVAARIPMTKVLGAWVVALPMAKVEGTLFKNGQEITVHGEGYHDHNWATINPGKFLDHWHWGKVHNTDIAIDYAVLIPKKPFKKPMGLLLVLDKNGVVMEPAVKTMLKGDVAVQLLNEKTEPELGLTFANGIRMTGKTGNTLIELEITLKRIVMKEKNGLPVSGESVYRYIGNETLTVTQDNEKKTYHSSLLHEIVFLH